MATDAAGATDAVGLAGAAEVRTRRELLLPIALAASVVVLQIAYPLVHGGRRDLLSALIVLVFAAACVTHAAATRGSRFAARLLLLTAVPGYAFEVLGVHTGFPFGSYAYGTTLGPRVLGVPPLVGLAWTMLAWPAAVAARRLARGFAARVVVGGWALAVGDLFLDPQMVAAGHWRWSDPGLHLPGVPDVPLTNYAGWLVVGLVISLALQTLLRTASGSDALIADLVPTALYLWLYVGWITALAAFLDLRAAAVWGALAMGTVAVPLARRTRNDLQATRTVAVRVRR